MRKLTSILALALLASVALAVPDRRAPDETPRNYPQFPDAATCAQNLQRAEAAFADLQYAPEAPDEAIRYAARVANCWGYAWKIQLKRADGFYPHLTDQEWRTMQADCRKYLMDLIGEDAFTLGDMPR